MRTTHVVAAALTALAMFVYAPTHVAALGAAMKPPQGAADASGQVDGGWPRAYSTPSGGQILIYQPQIAEWAQQEHMVAFAAVSYRAAGAAEPALGTIKLEAKSSVSLEKRLVNFSNLAITESNFKTIPADQNREIVTQLTTSIPNEERVIALDRVLASIDKSGLVPKSVEGIKADPPAIFFSKTPAALVNIDGDPIWSSIQGNDLKYVVNTNWDLFEHGPSSTFYLRNEDTWLKAARVDAPWEPAGTLPGSFGSLPDDPNWKDVKASLPGETATKPPVVFVSTRPAELILLEGQPRYTPVAGTQLLWVSNTESDVFRLGSTGPVYYLVAGRWFSAPDFSGPWAFATPALPSDFKLIPREHPRSRVLASVPGTDEAVEAVLLAQVPQTARVSKSQIQVPEVAYQGEPQYQPIDGTSLARAANTDKDIIKVADLYYMCYQGVWFTATGPNGPWRVTSAVPGQIYEIPASSPSHHVTYVEVEEDDDDDDDWVTFAYAAGYTGLAIAWGCAVWGTGWYYPPYVWRGAGRYPVYFPYARTYGSAAYYNPWTGSYGYAARAYGPYGGAAYGARYNATTGTYARGAAAWGPYGAKGVAQAYNPRTGTYAATRQGSNVYGSWGATSVQRGDQWAQTARVTNRATGTTTRVTQGSQGAAVSRRGPGGGGFVAAGQENVYAGHDGNVYKRNDGGGWSKYEDGGWNSVQKPTQTPKANKQKKSETTRPSSGNAAATRPAGSGGRQLDEGTYKQLEREQKSRADGAARTRDYSNWDRSGGGEARSFGSGGGASRSAASRDGGGRARGGGGGRRGRRF